MMFDTLNVLPSDPILGLMQAYRNDDNPHKVDLGIGIYKDNEGATPIMAAVQHASENLSRKQKTLAYVAPQGNAQFSDLLSTIILGDVKSALAERLSCVQTPGGCGALRIIAEVTKAASPDTTIWVSRPTWGNHRPLLSHAGLAIEEYDYLASDKRSLDWQAMQESISRIPQGDMVLLHACCHNPSGVDLTFEQWQWLTEAAIKQGFVPFVDMAYQGFGEGLALDAEGLRYMAARVPEMVLATSCSKNFGLYRERTGMACFIGQNAIHAKAMYTHALNIARGIYSMPPDRGASLVAEILSTESLKSVWLTELDQMRMRIIALRQELTNKMASQGHNEFIFVSQQKGMFSYLGISSEQVKWLAEHRSIYMLGTSRASIAGLSQDNLDYVSASLVEAINKVA